MVANCPHCGSPIVCRACGTPIKDMGPQHLPSPHEPEPPAVAGPSGGDQTFLIVAKGHGDLLDQLKEVVGDLGWVRLVEDRRQDETILPREGRQGTIRVDREISS
ncbi:MAG TPA: hypothetical protein VGW35_06175 [Methylomirabilota bacterium]|jgi:hypothetical protein|nr:hypothetical protein [Methylomirabilota bacterium]